MLRFIRTQQIFVVFMFTVRTVDPLFYKIQFFNSKIKYSFIYNTKLELHLALRSYAIHLCFVRLDRRFKMKWIIYFSIQSADTTQVRNYQNAVLATALSPRACGSTRTLLSTTAPSRIFYFLLAMMYYYDFVQFDKFFRCEYCSFFILFSNYSLRPRKD